MSKLCSLILSALIASTAIAAHAAGSTGAPAAAASAASAATVDNTPKALTVPTAIAAGDRIRLESKLYGLTLANGDDKAKTTEAIADRNACLRVTKIEGDTLTVVAEEEYIAGQCKETQLKYGEIYTIKAAKLGESAYRRYGWVYGPMIVPFKYFNHDHSFEPSQSLGMYLGYRISQFNRGVSFVMSAGAATMKVSTVTDKKDDATGEVTKVAKENTVAGYSLAAGVLFDLTREAKPFVAGLLIGKDYVGRNSALDYKHDGKTWVALQFGWDL